MYFDSDDDDDYDYDYSDDESSTDEEHDPLADSDEELNDQVKTIQKIMYGTTYDNDESDDESE